MIAFDSYDRNQEITSLSDIISERLKQGREINPDSAFLIYSKDTISYRDAWNHIDRISSCIEAVDADSTFVGVLANRDKSAYYGTLAAISAGCGYVSLTAKNPIVRLKKMAVAADLKTVFVGTGMNDLFLNTFKDFLWPVTGISTDEIEVRSVGQARLVDQSFAENEKEAQKRKPLFYSGLGQAA